MGVRRLVGWVAVAVLLAGCGGDSDADADDPPTTSSAPTATASESAGDEPTPPAMPAVASKPTRAGAVAFTKYFWAVVDYAEASGDTSELKRISGDKCELCQQGITGLEQLHADGGTVKQEKPRQTSAVKAGVQRYDGARAVAAHLRFTVSVGDQVEFFGVGDKRNRSLPGGSSEHQFLLGWVEGSRWVVATWEVL